MSIKQISVFVENRPGAMCEMTKVLANHGVDMRALSLAETEDFGIVRIIVDDIDFTNRFQPCFPFELWLINDNRRNFLIASNLKTILAKI